MNFKSIWNIWFPQEEAFSITTFYTSEKASQKLNLAIRQSCGMSGGATEREVFIRHTTPRRPQQQTYNFHGRWHNEADRLLLPGKFSAPTIEKVIVTLTLFFCIGMVLTAIANLTDWLPKKLSSEGLIFCLLTPVAILPSVTFIFAVKNQINNRQKKAIKHLLLRALR
ncbi:hypothetical protein QWQ33_004596 [Salmonella enterica]|nr:hypothetical protein [Salmonella enterica]ELO4115139.1 hypothetical protein [Salmonella enterica]ELO4115751.1 hypothetical protein [Salmonella enterica]